MATAKKAAKPKPKATRPAVKKKPDQQPGKKQLGLQSRRKRQGLQPRKGLQLKRSLQPVRPPMQK
jgi:hypothetical protein